MIFFLLLCRRFLKIFVICIFSSCKICVELINYDDDDDDHDDDDDDAGLVMLVARVTAASTSRLSVEC